MQTIQKHDQAPEQNSGPRFDLYRPIHKLIRHEGAELCALVGRTDFTDIVDVEIFEKEFNQFIEFLNQHAKHEEEQIHPLLKKVESKVLAGIENGHGELDERINDLKKKFSAVKSDSRTNDPHSLYQMLWDFTCFNVNHLKEEENLVSPELHKHFTDQDLIRVNGIIMTSMPQNVLEDSLKRMLPLLNHHERVGMYMGMKFSGMPDEAFKHNCRLADDALSQKSLKRDADKLFGVIGYQRSADEYQATVVNPNHGVFAAL